MGTQLSQVERDEMEAVAEGLPSKSAKIRALGRAGYARADIARFLEIRYQHVQNVLKQANLTPARTDREGGPAEAAVGAQGGAAAEAAWSRIGPGGKVAIPIACLEALGLAEGDDVRLVVSDDELRVVPRRSVIARIQKLVSEHAPEDTSLVEDLIAERRREAG